MEEVLTKPRYSVGVRGNIFSFLLPWDRIQQRLEWVDEDMTGWPMKPVDVVHLVRVRLVRGQQVLLKQCKELLVTGH